MTIQNAIKRISWRLAEGRWKHEKVDVDAINALIRGASNKSMEQIQNNELVTKLYVLAFGNELKHNGASIDDSIFQKEFHKLFSRPLSTFIRDFQYQLNNVEQKNLLEKYGFSENHPCLASTEEDNSDLAIINRVLKNEVEKEIILGREWAYDVTEKNLLTQISQFIDDYVR